MGDMVVISRSKEGGNNLLSFDPVFMLGFCVLNRYFLTVFSYIPAIILL